MAAPEYSANLAVGASGSKEHQSPTAAEEVNKNRLRSLAANAGGGVEGRTAPLPPILQRHTKIVKEAISSVKIHFSDPDEFIEELQQRPPDDKIVRITTRTTDTRRLLAVYLLYLGASYFRTVDNHPVITELEYYCGELIGTLPRTQTTRDKATAVNDRLTKAILELGFEVAAGSCREEVAHR